MLVRQAVPVDSLPILAKGLSHRSIDGGTARRSRRSTADVLSLRHVRGKQIPTSQLLSHQSQETSSENRPRQNRGRRSCVQVLAKLGCLPRHARQVLALTSAVYARRNGARTSVCAHPFTRVRVV